MLRPLLVMLSLSLFAFGTTTACGPDEEEERTFKCADDDSLRCDPDTEYCLQTFDGETELSASCEPIPEGCTECGCVDETQTVADTCGFLSICSSINDTNFRVQCEPETE